MRITERQMLLNSARQVSLARSRVAKAAGPVSSGIEVARPSDDPARWAAGRRARVRTQSSGLRGRALSTSNARLSESERVFASIGDALSRARSLAVLSANATQNQQSRNATAKEIQALFQETILAANTRGLDGEYLLAGTSGDQPPFDAAGVFQGDANARTIETSEGNMLEVTITGAAFTAAVGVDIFAELSAFQTALETNDLVGIQNAIGAFDDGGHQISLGRAEIGGLQSLVDDAESARTEFELVLAEVHQRAVEVDPIAAASELALGAQALEAAQALAQRIIAVTQVG